MRKYSRVWQPECFIAKLFNAAAIDNMYYLFQLYHKAMNYVIIHKG